MIVFWNSRNKKESSELMWKINVIQLTNQCIEWMRHIWWCMKEVSTCEGEGTDPVINPPPLCVSACLLVATASLRTTEPVRQHAMDFAHETLIHHLNLVECNKNRGWQTAGFMNEGWFVIVMLHYREGADLDVCRRTEMLTCVNWIQSGCDSLPVCVFMPAIYVHNLFRVERFINVWLGGVRLLQH